MTLLEMKKKILGLIEEWDPDHEDLTSDADIATKINGVINQVMFELARIKKIPRYVELPVEKGALITFKDIEKKSRNTVYQVALISGVKNVPRANNTVFKILESGTAEIDCYVYPERITEKTKDKAYEFELSDDVLEIMPYGAAADLLKSDASAEHGSIYQREYENKLQRLDARYSMPSISAEGGVDI